MTSPGIDPRLVADLAADITVLREQADRVGRGLNALHQSLATLAPQAPVVLQAPVAPQAPVVAPQAPIAPVQPGAPGAGPAAASWVGPWRPGINGPQPLPQQPVPPRPPLISPRPPVEARQPWWQRDGVVSKLLAIAGGVVTLIGVGMLVGLAIQAGWFGPQARVAAGGLLALALVGVAERLVRRPGGRVGALALGSTGIAALTVTVMATGDIGYRWLSALPAACYLLVVAAIGLFAAHRWESQAVAAITTVSLVVFTWPTLDHAPTTGAVLLLVVQAAALLVGYRRVWAVAHLCAGLVPLVALVHVLGWKPSAVGVAFSLVAMLCATVAGAATLRRAGEPLPRGLATAAAIAVVAPLLGLLVALGVNGAYLRIGDIVVLLVLAGVTAVAALPLPGSPLPGAIRVALGVVSAVSALRLSATVGEPLTPAVALIVVAVVLLAVSILTRSVAGWLTGWVFGVIALTVALDRYADSLFDIVQRDRLDGGAVMFGVLTVAAAAIGIAGQRRVRHAEGSDDPLVAGQVFVGALGLTLAVVAAGTLLGPDRTGWVAGHCAATVVWMIVAVASLQRGLVDRDNPRIWLAAGLGLAALATAKLFLFDLSSLAGVPRALAFLLVGVLLLVAGTRYARTFAERRGGSSEPSPDQSGTSVH